MFGIGTSELIIILGLALILLGPKKLPELARSLGRTITDLRKTTDELRESIAEEMEPIKEEMPDQEDLKEVLKEHFVGQDEEGQEEEEGKKEEQRASEGQGPETG